MDRDAALPLMSALAQPTRLAVFSLLVRSGPAGMIPSEIASAVGIPRNLMSAHLAVLAGAGLIRSSKAGRNQVCTAVPGAAAALAGFIARLAVDGA